jgi:hypothetical protein
MPSTDDLYIFRDDAIMYETVGGVSIDQQSGEWSFHEFESTDKFLKDFGQYEGAVEAFGNTVSNNAALAQLLSGNLDKATSILENVTDKNANTYYLMAICAARANDLEKTCAALKSVAGICKAKAANAATDLEFAKYWLLSDFKAAIQ